MNPEHVNPECLSSVAPQQLEVGTVQMNPENHSENRKIKEGAYCTLKHLLVWSLPAATQNELKPQITTMVCNNPEPDETNLQDAAVFAGVALESIHDGAMAFANPKSTGRVAIAVGGIVSIAVQPVKNKFFVGKQVWLHNTLVKLAPTAVPSGLDMFAWYVGQLTHENFGEHRAVGVVVDVNMVLDGYVRVRLH